MELQHSGGGRNSQSAGKQAVSLHQRNSRSLWQEPSVDLCLSGSIGINQYGRHQLQGIFHHNKGGNLKAGHIHTTWHTGKMRQESGLKPKTRTKKVNS